MTGSAVTHRYQVWEPARSDRDAQYARWKALLIAMFLLVVFADFMQERLKRKLNLSFSLSSARRLYQVFFAREFYLSLAAFVVTMIIFGIAVPLNSL
jgi:hypothetical protein